MSIVSTTYNVGPCRNHTPLHLATKWRIGGEIVQLLCGKESRLEDIYFTLVGEKQDMTSWHKILISNSFPLHILNWIEMSLVQSNDLICLPKNLGTEKD